MDGRPANERRRKIRSLTRRANWLCGRLGAKLPKCFGLGFNLSPVCSVCLLAPGCERIVALRGLQERTLKEIWKDKSTPSGFVTGSLAHRVWVLLSDWIDVHLLQRTVQSEFGNTAIVTERFKEALRDLQKRKRLYKRTSPATGAVAFCAKRRPHKGEV